MRLLLSRSVIFLNSLAIMSITPAHAQEAQTLEALGKIVHELVPFGIGGLAIAAVVMLAWKPQDTGRWLLFVGMLIVAAIFAFDKYWQPMLAAGSPKVENPTAPNSTQAMSSEVFWFPTGSKTDWGSHDLAHTNGEFPKYNSAHNAPLCDQDHIGNIATCWDNRSGGRVPNLDSDVPPDAVRWCTYKDATIRSYTPPTGFAPPGDVYVCSRPIARK